MMSKSILVLLLFPVMLLSSCGIFCRDITYEITGDGTTVSVEYYEGHETLVKEEGVALPWQRDVEICREIAGEIIGAVLDDNPSDAEESASAYLYVWNTSGLPVSLRVRSSAGEIIEEKIIGSSEGYLILRIL